MFKKTTLSFNDTQLFDPIMLDYEAAAPHIRPFYQHPFNADGFQAILDNNRYAGIDRPALVAELKKQEMLVSNGSAASLRNIDALLDKNTYTITTGHQLCLFTGPLYFVYKILSVITLCEELRQRFPGRHFVPVYWMASEDHDFEEINHAHVFGKKVTWNSAQKGSVGEFSTEGMAEVVESLKQILGESDNAKDFAAIVEEAYLKHSNLADATRYLVNALFANDGLVTLDGNAPGLKKLFTEELEKDLFENLAFHNVNDSLQKLSAHYHIQVNPREINLFYKDTQLRERITFENGKFNVLHTDLSFDEAGMRKLIAESPEKLSPNVVTRPLYQQKILPNIAYVGGPGELAYWLEYKAMFDAFGLQFPILAPRLFAALVDKGTEHKLEKLGLGIKEIFGDADALIKTFVKSTNDGMDAAGAQKALEAIYHKLLAEVSAVDKTLEKTVEAEKQKALNGLHTLEQKLNRALKQKSENEVNHIYNAKAKLFPNGSPQERYDNISMYYVKYGKGLIAELKQHLRYELGKNAYIVLTEA